MLLEERLNSIFEDGPQRTLAILQSDGHTVQSYVTPTGWSVVDFALHPSGDISAILTTTTEVRIVRFDPNGSIRSDQPFLDSAAAMDPFFNHAGGIKNDDALQPALMHDAARLAPLAAWPSCCVPAAMRLLLLIVLTLTRVGFIGVPGGP